MSQLRSVLRRDMLSDSHIRRRAFKASCLAGIVGLVATASGSPQDQVFRPSKQEINAVKASGLPYIDGDFTLTYRVRDVDVRSDAQRKADFDKDYAEYKAALDEAVKKGTKTRDAADSALSQQVFQANPPAIELTVTVSSRNGLLLYKELDGKEILLTPNRAFFVWPDHIEVSPELRILYWTYLPLPAAGFAHFPLSFSRLDAKASRVTAPDLPIIGAINGKHETWGSGIVSDLVRNPGIVEFDDTGISRSVSRIMRGTSLEYEFHNPIRFKGVLIASEFTRFLGSRRIDFTLTSAAAAGLPPAEYNPAHLVRDKPVEVGYKGGSLHFTGDPREIEFQAQVDREAAIEAKRAAQASGARPDSTPAGQPDIMPLFAQALRRAKAEGKVVLAVTTASSCAACHVLAKMFEDRSIKAILDNHYVVLWIDCGEVPQNKRYENVNGEKLTKRLGILTGFPSYAAVGTDGKVLAVAGSIGYPTDAGGYEKFFEVLNAGSHVLSDGETEVIRAYLDNHR